MIEWGAASALSAVWRLGESIAKMFRKKIVLEFVAKRSGSVRGFSCELMIRNHEDFGVTLTNLALRKPEAGNLRQRALILFVGQDPFTGPIARDIGADIYVPPDGNKAISFAFLPGEDWRGGRLDILVTLRRNGVPTGIITRPIRETLPALTVAE